MNKHKLKFAIDRSNIKLDYTMLAHLTDELIFSKKQLKSFLISSNTFYTSMLLFCHIANKVACKA